MKSVVLVLFLKWGYSGGVVAIPTPNMSTCLVMEQQAKEMGSYQDSLCIKQGG